MGKINLYLNTLRQKGYLAYEYNPFHNYQTEKDLYLVDEKFLVPADQAVNIKNGELLVKRNGKWVDKRGRVITKGVRVPIKSTPPVDENDNPIPETKEEKQERTKYDPESTSLYATAGSLIDMDTEQLNFDLKHPVDIEVQPSYDGSVNLILNDDKNIPRLINSRFSPREKNTYEIVDRIGENDTNIYNSKTFDKDTSLYFQYESNPTITYLGFIKGVLPVGQYCFYFTYCDADDNESDYIAETGLIPLFIGSDRDTDSIDGGIKNQLSNKGVRLRLNNIDKSYNYLKVYYVRYFADYQQNRVYDCKKILKRYYINDNTFYLQITGDEATEELDPDILNIERFNPKHILTQAQCKNMLFFGNLVKNVDNYRELTDCALRIIPEFKSVKFNPVEMDYSCKDPDYGYYSSSNIYNKVGYFNKEYYRFGVVFIYNNGTLSNVYNTLGYTFEKKDTPVSYNSGTMFVDLSENDEEWSGYDKEIQNETFLSKDGLQLRNFVKLTETGWIDQTNKIGKSQNSVFGEGAKDLNGKGVCRINLNTDSEDEIINVKFKIPEEVAKYLKEELGIRGMFFVRQKCVPNILAQCYLLPMDEVMEGPVLEVTNGNDKEYYTESFVAQSSFDPGILINTYSSRLYKYDRQKYRDAISKQAYAAICPDFLLNQPYFNQIFNGANFRIQKVKDSKLEKTNQDRIYNENSGGEYNYTSGITPVKICTVTEDVPTVALNDKAYRLEMGETEEAYRFRCAEYDSGTYDSGDEDFEAINSATNIVRGMFSPYLAIYSNTALDTSCLYNIYQYNTVAIAQEYQNRMDSSEPFYAISDRYNFEDLGKPGSGYSLVCYRGDCYINTFTYRLNRNFNDPSLPNSDQIIDKSTWKDNYKVENPEDFANISRADVNAVQLGSWITIRLKSAVNYALRSQDHSYVSEEALMGAPRSYYPRNRVMWRGENKMPDSYLYNDAYRATLGFKQYYTLGETNYVKDSFSNRIQYSAMAITDSFKNNYRYSLTTYFRDYSIEYGSITRLIGLDGYLLVVFEHAVAIAPINERVLAGQGEGEPVFINTANVLPEELTILTDTHGSQWGESVIKTESGAVYGVDTITKKIWRVLGQQFGIISDLKVNKFLVENITLSERELYPIIGLKNVKSHYNNNKKDVIFTFYDDKYKDEENVWSLCFNELMDEFITFYSWVPSYSENIDTQFFSFDRDTSKKLALLGLSNYSVPENNGVLVDNPVLDESNSATLRYKYSTGDLDPNVRFKFIKDHWGNWDKFEHGENLEITGNKLTYKGDPLIKRLWDAMSNLEFKTVEDNNGNSYEVFDIDAYNEQLYNQRYGVICTQSRKEPCGNSLCCPQDTLEIGESYTLQDYDGAGYIDNLPEAVYAAYTLWNILSSEPYSKDLENVFSDRLSQSIEIFEIEDYKDLMFGHIVRSQFNKVMSENSNFLSKEFYDWVRDKTKWESGEQFELNCLSGVILLQVQPYYVRDLETDPDMYPEQYLYPETIAVTPSFTTRNNLDTRQDKLTSGMTTDFYLHGRAGLFDLKQNIYPCNWYGKYHPFEFEFVVNDNIAMQKIFTNLVIISNKAEPESFHFEIEGDNYEFSSDKRTMYFRQEASKNYLQETGSDILYNRDFTDIMAIPYTHEQYYRGGTEYINDYSKVNTYPKYKYNLVQSVKSTIFPLYYERIDTYDEIYHKYSEITGAGYDFKNLSGTELVWDRDLNQFNLVTHIKNSPINLYGRIRGNSFYEEGRWKVQIPSITLMQKNEFDENDNSTWVSSHDTFEKKDSPLNDIEDIEMPPIVINRHNREGLTTDEVLPNIYENKYIDSSSWSLRKESKIRDKWMKVRIRYSGKNLAVIHSIATLYTISYS